MSNKLELFWFGKDDENNVEPRILIEDKEKSYKAESKTLLDDAIYDNVLIHGDNLLGLKALEKSYANKIKCIYIDPPYNTGSAFEHYDDNLEHSTWLSLMRDRLNILYNLLTDDGTIWISIDADESHYLKVLCDELFGRKNFIDEVVWQRSFSPINLKKTLSRAHDTILVYAKNYTYDFELGKLPRTAEANSRYKNPDNDPRGPWTSGDLSVGPAVEANIYEITTPSGRKVLPPAGYSWRLNKDRFAEFVADNRIWFGPDGNNTPRIKRFLCDVKDGVTPMTWWTREEIGDNQEAKREIKALGFSSKPFDTPKPERLIERILTIATKPGDIVLDSFLGSGTTIAVAHKMKRRWVGIEMEDTAYIYCKPRLDKIINGDEKGGVTKSTGWTSGGGYKFYELAPTLINEDSFGQSVINPEYNSDMLAAAIAIHEGYKYNPSKECYWKQSNNENNSYLFVTTNHVTKQVIDSILVDLKEDEHLLISCKSYDTNVAAGIKNISIKKIPQSLLKNCEFGKDNYNLNIVCPPEYEEEDDE